MTLKPKSSRLMEIISAGVSGGRWRITALIFFSEFGEKVKYWRLCFSRYDILVE
jgi:hypothetical protein